MTKEYSVYRKISNPDNPQLQLRYHLVKIFDNLKDAKEFKYHLDRMDERYAKQGIIGSTFIKEESSSE